MKTKSPSVFRVLTVLSISLILAMPFLSVYPVAAATIFEDGFESGDLSKWSPTGGSPTVTSGDAHHGTYKAVLDAAAESAQTRFTGVDHAFMRAYVMFKSFPPFGGETTILGVYNYGSSRYMAEARVGHFVVGGTIMWRLRYWDNGAHYTVTSEQHNPALDTWYCVEVEGKSNTATDAEARIYIDGNELTDISQTGKNNTLTITSGYMWASTAVTQWYDCVVISDAYIGPEDLTPPTFGASSTNTTVAGYPCTFNGLVNDNTNVSSYIFSTNNTGVWTNDTAVAFSSFYNSTTAWATATKTLNDTVDSVVSYRWYANDTTDNWSHSLQYNLTVTAPQWYLTLVSPYGTPGGQGWYSQGSTANATLDTDTVDHGNGTRRVFTNWSGDASGTVFSQSDPITMTANKTAVAVWKTQYNVTFTQSGLDASASGTVVTVNSVPVEYNQLPYAVWIDSGGTVTYAYSNVSSTTGGKRFTLTTVTGQPSPLTVTGPMALDGNYTTQYQVTFDQTGVGSDFTGTLVTIAGENYTYALLPAAFWWDDGASHTFTFASPLVVNASKQYNWTSTAGLSTLQSDTLTITGAGSVTGNYGTQTRSQVAFNVTGVTGAFPDTVVIIDGINYTLAQLPIAFWWDDGSSHTFAFQSPLIEVPNSKQYLWISTTGLSTLQDGTIIVSTSGNVTAVYKTQYYLAVSSTYDSPTPTSGWFDAGTDITASVTSPVAGPTGTRYTCTGWTGTGDVPATGTGVSVNFTITQDSNITWSWTTQHLLTVLTDPDGLSPQPARDPAGDAESPISWWYDESVSINLTAQDVEWYTFNYWAVDDASQGNGVNPITAIIDAPHTAVAYYFLSDVTPPEIVVLSPENTTYYTASVPLEFTINETASWMGYSLDGQANSTISGNTTLVVGEGSHSIIVYANDTAGNMGASNVVYFTARTGVSDIAILSVQTSKTIIGQGYTLTINVTLENQGDYVDSFNVTLYGNATVIDTQVNVLIPIGSNTVLTITWNTSEVAKGNYTITAYATLVPGETDTTDNEGAGGWVFVTIPGDVDGDRDVDIFDIVRMAGVYGLQLPNPRYDPNCDVDGDGDIDIFDIVAAASNYSKTW